MAGLTKDDDETEKMQETSFDLLDDDDLLTVYESDVQKPSYSSIAPTPEKRDTATIVTTVKRKRVQEKLPTFNDMIDQRTISEQHHRKQYQREQQQMEKEIDWCLKMMDGFYYLKGDQFKRKCIICVITRKKHTSEHKNQ